MLFMAQVLANVSGDTTRDRILAARHGLVRNSMRFAVRSKQSTKLDVLNGAVNVEI
jgi:hypothetical protein